MQVNRSKRYGCRHLVDLYQSGNWKASRLQQLAGKAWHAFVICGILQRLVSVKKAKRTDLWALHLVPLQKKIRAINLLASCVHIEGTRCRFAAELQPGSAHHQAACWNPRCCSVRCYGQGPQPAMYASATAAGYHAAGSAPSPELPPLLLLVVLASSPLPLLLPSESPSWVAKRSMRSEACATRALSGSCRARASKSAECIASSVLKWRSGVQLMDLHHTHAQVPDIGFALERAHQGSTGSCQPHGISHRLSRSGREQAPMPSSQQSGLAHHPAKYKVGPPNGFCPQSKLANNSGRKSHRKCLSHVDSTKGSKHVGLVALETAEHL